MNATEIITRAGELRSALHRLMGEFSALEFAAANCTDLRDEHREVRQVSCELAKVYQSLPDLYIEFARL